MTYLFCSLIFIGSDRRDEKSNHMKTILSGVFGTIGFLAFVILGVLIVKKQRWLTRVNTLFSQRGEPLASPTCENDDEYADPDSGQPNENQLSQVLFEESQNLIDDYVVEF